MRVRGDRGVRGVGVLRGYVELARVSNLPTCVSNVLVGCALGSGGGVFSWPVVLTAGGGVCLLYVFGVVLNDIIDADADRGERPARPIPSGRVTRTGAWLVALFAAGAGVGLVGALGPVPLLIGVVMCVLIVCYNLVHRWWRWASVLMGAVRGLVYPLGAFAACYPLWPSLATWALSVTLMGYIVALSEVARFEATSGRPELNRVVAVPVVPVLALVAVQPARWPWVMVVGVAMLAWLGRAARRAYGEPARVVDAVHGWLAGIGLVDAFFLTLLDRPGLAVVATGAWVVTVWGHRSVPGT